MRVGKRGEGFGLGRSLGQCCFKVGWSLDRAGCVVNHKLDLDEVSRDCAGARSNVFSHAQNVDPGAGNEGVAIGESIDGGADGHLAFAAENRGDAEGDLEVSPCAAGAAAD